MLDSPGPGVNEPEVNGLYKKKKNNNNSMATAQERSGFVCLTLRLIFQFLIYLFSLEQDQTGSLEACFGVEGNSASAFGPAGGVTLLLI